LIVKRRMSVV